MTVLFDYDALLQMLSDCV